MLAAILVLLLGGPARPAWADRVAAPESYRCNGEPLVATLHSGDVDDLQNVEWMGRNIRVNAAEPRTGGGGGGGGGGSRW